MYNPTLDSAFDALERFHDSNEEVTTPLTLTDVVVRTATCLGVTLTAAVPGWLFLSGQTLIGIGLLISFAIVSFVIGRTMPMSPPKALLYFTILGLLTGAGSKSWTLIGGTYELIPQAILGTLCGAVGMVLLYSTPFGRQASRGTQMFLGMITGYLILGVISIIAAYFGVGNGLGLWGLGTFGIVFGLVGVALATWSFLIELGRIDTAITAGVPHTWSWAFGVGVASSLVWMYLEILRLLTLSRK